MLVHFFIGLGLALSLQDADRGPGPGAGGSREAGEAQEPVVRSFPPIGSVLRERFLPFDVPGLDTFGVTFRGYSVTAIGDLDGDGIEELALGKPDEDGSTGPDTGAVWILFLDREGNVREAPRLEPGSILAADDRFGIALAGLGDLDGDGVGDLAVGESGDNSGGIDHGALWIFFLTPDGGWHARQKISEVNGGFGGVLGRDAFGFALDAIGDLDGDGMTDLAVGAQQTDLPEQNTGAVWILFLNADGTVKSEVRIDRAHTGGLLPIDGGDFFGYSLAWVGDTDGDGVGELAVGATGTDGGIPEAGAVWILALGPDASVLDVRCLRAPPAAPAELAGRFGASVVRLGDLDGDGGVELGVGALGPDDAGPGALWYVYLAPDGTPRDYQVTSRYLNGFESGRLGASLAVLHLDLDRVPEVVSNGQLLFLRGLARLGFDVEDDFLTPLVDGQAVTPEATFGRLLSIEGRPVHGPGAAIFDSDPDGPNRFTSDPDLLVDRGNLLILQEHPTQSVPGVYDVPDDDAFGGVLTLDLASLAVAPLALDLVDVCPGGGGARVTLTDARGRERTYDVPDGWTEDVLVHGPPGFGTLDLTTLAPQPGFLATATASEEDGFHPLQVRRLEVELLGSGAVDELVFEPVTDLAAPDVALRGTQQLSQSEGDLDPPLPSGYLFGTGLAPLGDLDGDGALEVAVTAPGPLLADTGDVRVLTLEPDGTVRSESAFGGGTSGCCFGYELAALGDVDGDGVADLAVSDPGFFFGTDPAENSLWIVFLAPDGSVSQAQELRPGVGGLTFPLLLLDGHGLVSPGDLDGDGVPELAVQAWDSPTQPAFWMLFLHPDGTVRQQRRVDGLPFLGLPSAIGDLDGDGVGDLFASVRAAPVGNRTEGMVLFLQPDGGVRATTRIDRLDDLGSGAALDVDGDGTQDLIVSQGRADYSPNDSFDPLPPQLSVLYMHPDGTVRTRRRLAAAPPELASLAVVGDLDGDGLPDLVGGDPGNRDGLSFWFLNPKDFLLCPGGAVHTLRLDGWITVDLDTAGGAPLANGTAITPATDFPRVVVDGTSASGFGPAVFDSRPGGPNALGPDPDLLVDRGNVLILQGQGAQDPPGVYTVPDDDPGGGVLTFDFPDGPVEPVSLDLVDLDEAGATVTLLDASGRARIHDVPAGFTGDVLLDGPPGWRTLDLRTRAPQRGRLVTATALEEEGFDPRAIVRIEVHLAGSAAVDRLRFDPHP